MHAPAILIHFQLYRPCMGIYIKSANQETIIMIIYYCNHAIILLQGPGVGPGSIILGKIGASEHQESCWKNM